MSEQLDYLSMRASDIAEVMRIENGAYSHPWTSGIFLDCLKSGYRSILVYRDGKLVGYSVVMDVLDESHLLNLTVVPSMQGKGIGRNLLEQAINEAQSQGKRMMLLEVRASNTKAIRLYERTGFYRVHVRKNYYPTATGRENAIIMGLSL